METLKSEVDAALTSQSELITAAQAKVDENTSIIENVNTEMETIKNLQET